MKTIWKYELEIKDVQDIEIPEGAKLLHIANQNGGLCVWFEVDQEARKKMNTFAIVGTGNAFDPKGFEHIGSVIINPFVWHVFQKTILKELPNA